jgi:AAA15 family ATPase/GTPase
MRLKQLKISNYKCFRDSGWIELDPHMTVVVGRNNVGKTALLEGLGLNTWGDECTKIIFSPRRPSLRS